MIITMRLAGPGHLDGMSTSYRSRITPWQIDERDFYELESRDEQLAFLLRYAILAPSGHNMQPWSFRITDEGVEAFADITRTLAIVDPNDRELLMSVGAAITNLRVAAAHFGFRTSVLYQPRPEISLPVALITLEETCAPDAALESLFAAIRRRHTNRKPFQRDPIEPEALAAVCDVLDEYPNSLSLLMPSQKSRVAKFIEHGDRLQMGSDAFRGEMADILRAPDTEAGDGLCADTVGIPPIVTPIAPWLLRRGWSSANDRELLDTAAMLVVISADDDRVALIQAGEIAERLLLTITKAGLSYSFLNQPIQVAELRSDFARFVGCRRPPQLLIRVGRAVESSMRRAPRRPLESVMMK
jgi:hypothetical protein